MLIRKIKWHLMPQDALNYCSLVPESAELNIVKTVLAAASSYQETR